MVKIIALLVFLFPASGWGQDAPFLELENVYFDTASAEIRQDDLIGLSVIANFLREMPAEVSLLVEGHADERGSMEANLALGWRRAEAVKAYLVHLGADPARIYTDSYGEERPADPGHEEEAWARNRRVEFYMRIE